jgi:hypothetical protein
MDAEEVFVNCYNFNPITKVKKINSRYPVKMSGTAIRICYSLDPEPKEILGSTTQRINEKLRYRITGTGMKVDERITYEVIKNFLACRRPQPRGIPVSSSWSLKREIRPGRVQAGCYYLYNRHCFRSGFN